MSDDELPQEAALCEVRSQLSDGLKSCRTVVANYRAFLTGEPHAEIAVNDDDPPTGNEIASRPQS